METKKYRARDIIKIRKLSDDKSVLIIEKKEIFEDDNVDGPNYVVLNMSEEILKFIVKVLRNKLFYRIRDDQEFLVKEAVKNMEYCLKNKDED